jgi:hypothetical protein
MPNSDLDSLKQRWLNSGSFKDEQAYLAARVHLKDARFVYLDPDGTLPEWIGMVVRCETGVVYGSQCAGVAIEQRLIEGYFVPIGGLKYSGDDGQIKVGLFREIFHERDTCEWKWTGRELPAERLARLKNLVSTIPYWRPELDGVDQKFPVRLDATRVEQLAEAWLPILTPDGPGVPLHKNCD